MNFKANFGLRLKELRKAKNFSQEQFAEIIGITPRNLSKIETGQAFPSSSNLEKIFEALEVPPYYLFDFGHCSKPEDLREEINKYLSDFNHERLKDVYKIVKALSI